MRHVVFQSVPPIPSCCAAGSYLARSSVLVCLSSCCFWHAGCAGMVRSDACLYAGDAHASVTPVLKYVGKMKTVQRMLII